MRRAEYVASDFFSRSDGQGEKNLTECIRLARRDCLTDILAWCHHHPDAPAQAVIRFIHAVLSEGQL